MRFLKLDLLTLLISLFLFASCEKTSTIGLEIDPSTAIQGSLIDTATINSRTVQDDIISSVVLARHPFGYIKDPIFGETEASLAMTVNLPNDGYSFGTSPLLDSAVLVLNYGGEFYGDSTQNYNINVSQLRENMTTANSYLSSKDWAHFTTILGSKSGKIYPNTRYKVTDIVKGKADTLKTVTPQIRLQLDKPFMQALMTNITAADLKFNENFIRYFNGLHVNINKASTTGVGGMMFFDFANTNSRLELYYRSTNATTSAIDTNAVSFPISTSINPVASTIKQNYAGTPIAVQLSNPTQQFPVTYLQPLSGLRNKISFPYLKNFTANVGKVVVNKAELVIDLSTGTNPIPFNAAPRLALYRYDIAEQRRNIPDNDRGSSTIAGDPRAARTEAIFGGYFDVTKNRYVFVVTAYIQDLLDGKTQDYGTFLAPTPVLEFGVLPSLSTGARTVIESYKKNPAAGDKMMKLNIYYTKIN